MNLIKDHLPQPVSNADSKFYWEMASQSRFFIRRCQSCNQTHFMPRYLCPHCWSEKLEWIEASGKGVVHSFTIIRRASLPLFQAETPYVLALIELDEGPRMMANILGDDFLDIQIGDLVRVVFESRGDMKLPQFVKAKE